ncbi:MAG: hypothetical protein MUF65_02280 [Rubritepida sp.]|jgi:hypothetical protein|nr:hypothetical protein [Rubritepida sp.]MCU0944179.1 hypothetical protein [Rubritepida sp.]
MASVFRAPKPVVVPAAPSPAPAPAADPAAASAAEADRAAETARVENRTRARQGVGGTIATSARGVLAPLPLSLARKSLLGE